MESKSESLLTEEDLSWIGTKSAAKFVDVSRRDIIKYSVATQQLQKKYLEGDEAPPMFIFNLFGNIVELDKLTVDGLAIGSGKGPKLPLKRTMAGGTELVIHRAIRPGDRLRGTTTITDMYEKQGSTGPLIFTVRTLSIVLESGEAVIDEIQTAIAR